MITKYRTFSRFCPNSRRNPTILNSVLKFWDSCEKFVKGGASVGLIQTVVLVSLCNWFLVVFDICFSTMYSPSISALQLIPCLYLLFRNISWNFLHTLSVIFVKCCLLSLSVIFVKCCLLSFLILRELSAVSDDSFIFVTNNLCSKNWQSCQHVKTYGSSAKKCLVRSNWKTGMPMFNTYNNNYSIANKS